MKQEDISLEHIDRLCEILLVYRGWSGDSTSLCSMSEQLAIHATENGVQMTELVAMRYVRSYARRNHLRIKGTFEKMRLNDATFTALDGSMVAHVEPTFIVDPEAEEDPPLTDPVV